MRISMKWLLYTFSIHKRYDRILQHFVGENQCVISYMSKGVSRTFVEHYPPIRKFIPFTAHLEPFGSPEIESVCSAK